MTNLNVIKKDNKSYTNVNGEMIELTLEVMNIVSPNIINDEFYSDIEEFEYEIAEETRKLNDVNNTIETDETRLARIESLQASISFAKEFIK